MMAALPHPLLDALTTAVQLEILTVAPMTPQEREDMLSRMRPAVVPERREFRDQAAYRHARDAATAAADLNPLTHLDDLLYGGTRTSAAFAAITRVLALASRSSLTLRTGGAVRRRAWPATRRWSRRALAIHAEGTGDARKTAP
jgi:hypothetical protein